MTKKQFSWFLRIPTIVITAILFTLGIKIQIMIYLTSNFELDRGLILSAENISGIIKAPKTNIRFNRTDINYEYRYNGQNYRSDGITYLLFYDQYEYQYHMGQNVNVYVNKKNPSESVLIVGTQEERNTNIFYLALIMVLELAIIALLILIGKNPILFIQRNKNLNKKNTRNI